MMNIKNDNEFASPPSGTIPVSILYNKIRNIQKNLLINIDFIALPSTVWRTLKIWYKADDKVQRDYNTVKGKFQLQLFRDDFTDSSFDN
jgi:hypothetical protein